MRSLPCTFTLFGSTPRFCVMRFSPDTSPTFRWSSLRQGWTRCWLHEARRFEVASSIEPIVVLVQTGPWLRRLRLVAGADGGASSANERVSFGQMLGSGLLHLDREMGEVVDERSLEALLHAPLFVEAEDVTTDVDAAKRAYIGDDRLAMFLSEGVDAEQTQGLNKHPVARRVLRINGGRFLDGFGWLALAMGLGSVVLWCKPRN